MQAERAATKPHAAARGEVRRCRLLHAAEHIAIERSRGRLLSRRHRECHVIKTDDFEHLTPDYVRTRPKVATHTSASEFRTASASEPSHASVSELRTDGN